jgi:hypothetical protein
MSIVRHSQPHFFKFATTEAALKIIEGRSLKWSSATAFNDPFDHQAGFSLDLEESHFAKLLTDSMLRVIFSNAPISVGASARFTQMLLTLRLMRDRLQQNQIGRELYDASLEVAKNIREGINDFNAAIHAHLLHSRVLCVTEAVNNVVMWSHYADQHRGVAFQLGCIESLDNRLLAAKRIEYTDKFIAFPSSTEYAQHLTGEKPIDMTALVWKIAFTKHLDWAYEREWRVHIPLLNERPEDDFSIYTEPSEVFQAMYIGCRMPQEQASVLISAARRALPNMALFRAMRANDSFNLRFVPLDET